jgi:hypothetical protein
LEDEYFLEEIVTDHPLQPGALVPFVVRRLSGPGQAEKSVVFTIVLENVGERSETRRLRIHWELDWEAADAATRGFEEETVTEIAACGVACVLMARYTTARVVAVARRGQGFDYTLAGVDEETYALEVSGVMSASLRGRHRVKREEFLRNAEGLDGYVVVVRFAGQEAILSFHQIRGGR